MRRSMIWVLLLGALLCAAALRPVLADGSANSPSSQPTNADETPGPMTQLGDRLIDELPPIPFGEDSRTYLMVTQADKPFATSRTALVSEGHGDEIHYSYTDVSMVRGQNGGSLEVRTTGILNRRFRPVKLRWEIIDQQPSGTYTKTTEDLTIDDDEMVSVKTDAKGRKTEKRFPTPKENFVYLVGDLIRMLKLEPGQTFILRDLDTDTGKLVRRTYSVKKKGETQLRVGIRMHPSKVETEYYLLDTSHAIVRHAIHRVGLTFNAATKAKIEAAENAMRRYRKAATNKG